MANFTDDDDALLAELGIEVEAKKLSRRTPREERIVAGFEEIQRFVDEHGVVPHHGEERDIFERLYAVRLDRIRELEECRALVAPIDTQGLLSSNGNLAQSTIDELDDDALLAELGVEIEVTEITTLTHVRSTAEKQAAEEIANRERCEDFENFKPLFERVQADLKAGTRSTLPFVKDAGFSKAEITVGQFFILGGQTLYVADVGEPIKAPNGDSDARLRLVYSNGTESNLLLRSLQRALYKDAAGRRISDPSAGPLFAESLNDEDSESGTIYVLRSLSDNPTIAANREIFHKIGVTGGSVEKRVSNAKLDATFLLADVEIVATYKLFNINRAKLEKLIHRVFDRARLEIDLKDRFGNSVIPREWFLVPLFVIDEVVERIKNGTIYKYTYDQRQAKLIKL
ncbi:hypothetical protein FHS77_002779 [Paenochrobactrum gallinarii]|uniref:Bacteriophage T5 Orf172 DNA-binding domain-containing protein n=1 Tax=Paenochrobactrum gallinarii TaxID=643673 RepID=A0A841M0D2_9HYPH|nr:GIY-YIG nuclease family protein [Paenochrobactrum gallinarii]MBB6262207.1 hypothetical protein [Paenochrobactrum gallinarii]